MGFFVCQPPPNPNPLVHSKHAGYVIDPVFGSGMNVCGAGDPGKLGLLK